MQIDGHHAATYVAARAAGFDHGEASTVAYAAQYVDDATNGGAILFESSEFMYFRIASAHGMIDYQNVIDVANHLAWLPFHFLPGNGGLPAGQTPPGGALSKLVCRPDSPVARDMLRATLDDRDRPRALYRLGIAMHVYADTFAHQGFVGAISEANRVVDAAGDDGRFDAGIREASRQSFTDALKRRVVALGQMLWTSFAEALREHQWPTQFWQDFLGKTPLGHAAADTFPDQPYLAWSYVDWQSVRIHRNNHEIFLTALDQMTRALRAWREKDRTMALERHEGLPPADAAVASRLFGALVDPDGAVRHRAWLDAIAAGNFSFGREELAYIPKGPGSWKNAALGTVKSRDSGYERYPYSEAFLTSHWKLFHDAVHAHREAIVHDILPRYGICAA